jgi:hypothetical protein
MLYASLRPYACGSTAPPPPPPRRAPASRRHRAAPRASATGAAGGAAAAQTTVARPAAVIQGTPLRSAALRPAYDALVVGSGIGGLAAAAALARFAGRRVLVLEQHYTAGGFTHAFKRGRFAWNVGVHYVGARPGAGGLAARPRPGPRPSAPWPACAPADACCLWPSPGSVAAPS